MSGFTVFPERVFTTEERTAGPGEVWAAVDRYKKPRFVGRPGKHQVGDLVIDFTAALDHPRPSRRSLPTHWIKCTNGERVVGVGESWKDQHTGQELCYYYVGRESDAGAES